MFLDLLRQEKHLSQACLSPWRCSAQKRTGKFRLGIDRLLTADDGKSWISFEDFAVALDEIERQALIRPRFTVDYQAARRLCMA